MHMKPIKVLFIISNLSGGGAEYVARKNIELLSKEKDFEVYVITSDLEWKHDNVDTFIAYDFSKEKSIFNRSVGSLYLYKNAKVMKVHLNAIKPDIIHIHDYIRFTPALLKEIKKYKRQTNCSIIMTHHTYNYVCTNDSLYNYKKKEVCTKCLGKYDGSIIKDCCSDSYITAFGKYIQKKIFKRIYIDLVDKHIVPSKFMKKQLLRGSKDKDIDIQVVYNPCIEEVMPVNLKKNKGKIVYFGRISKEKNIVGFIECFLKSKSDLQLLIIGTGNQEKNVKNIIKRNSSNNIQFINKFLKTQELYSIISNAQFFVLPSVWYENSPVSIVEGINLSIIPVVNNIGGMKELIEMFQFGFSIDMNKENEIIKLLKKIDSKSFNYDILKYKNTREILKKFTYEKYINIIKNIYIEQSLKGD